MKERQNTILRLVKSKAIDSCDSHISGNQEALIDGANQVKPPKREKPLIKFLSQYCDAIDADIERILKS